jgi:hypothetical protein
MERIKTLEEESDIDVSGMVETETISPRHTSNENVDDEVSDAVIRFAESITYDTYSVPHSLNGKGNQPVDAQNNTHDNEDNVFADKRCTLFSSKRRSSEVNLNFLPLEYPRLEAPPDDETKNQRQKRFRRFKRIIKVHEEKNPLPLTSPPPPPPMVVKREHTSSDVNLNLQPGYPRLDATPDGETKNQRMNRFLRFKRHTEEHEEKLKSGHYEQTKAPKTIVCVYCNNIYYSLKSVSCHERICHRNPEVKLNRLKENNPEVKRNRKEEERKWIDGEEHRLKKKKRKQEEKERLEHSEDWVTEQFEHMQQHRVTELEYPRPHIYDYSNNSRTYHETYSLPPPSLNEKRNQPVDPQNNTHDNEDNIPCTGHVQI